MTALWVCLDILAIVGAVAFAVALVYFMNIARHLVEQKLSEWLATSDTRVKRIDAKNAAETERQRFTRAKHAASAEYASTVNTERIAAEQKVIAADTDARIKAAKQNAGDRLPDVNNRQKSDAWPQLLRYWSQKIVALLGIAVVVSLVGSIVYGFVELDKANTRTRHLAVFICQVHTKGSGSPSLTTSRGTLVVEGGVYGGVYYSTGVAAIKGYFHSNMGVTLTYHGGDGDNRFVTAAAPANLPIHQCM